MSTENMGAVLLFTYLILSSSYIYTTYVQIGSNTYVGMSYQTKKMPQMLRWL